jgi:RHS repeat-associated protein
MCNLAQSFEPVTRAIGPLSNGVYPVTCTKYDTLGHPVELWAGTSTNATAATCDLTGADPNLKRQLSTQYDDFGRKLKETDPLGKITTYLYDRNNNLTEATDPKGQKTLLSWGPGHQLLSRTVNNADGTIYQTVVHTRNALGQPTRIETRDGAGLLIAAVATTYDAAHRVKTVNDSRGNKTLTYTWSPGGQLATLQDNEGRRTDYLYDPVGRLIGIWAPNNDYIAYSHDAGGRLIEKWYPNGVNSQLAWNPDDSLAQLKNRVAYDDAHVISRHDYTYSGLGQRQSLLEKVGTLAQPAQDEAYGYDAWDNRVSQSKAGQTTFTISNAAHQIIELRTGSPTGTLAAAYLYDANSNLTRKCEGGTVTQTASDCTGASVTSLAWNPLDQLVQVSKTGLPTESYAYDHAGRRSSKTVGATTTHYLYNGEDLHAEYTTWPRALAVYTHGPETDDPLIRSTATQTIYYHRDGLGSVVATSDPAGNIAGARTYDAWGNVLAQTGNIPTYGYTGREPDATGLIYYRARYYDPGIGRFISKDPAGMPDGVNRYAYVGNDPVNATDPSGEIALNTAGAAAGGIYGGLSGGISGAIVGWNSIPQSDSLFNRAKQALIGFGAGAATGATVGAIAGFYLRPELAASAPMAVATGVVGGLFSNLTTTSAQQISSKQRVNPLAKLTWQESGKILASAAGGGAAVAGGRLVTGLASSTTSLVAGKTLPMSGNLVEAVLSGIGAGYGESAVARSESAQTNQPPVATVPTSGSQNLGSFSFAELAAPGGNPWGTSLSNDYTVTGRSGCFKCQH